MEVIGILIGWAVGTIGGHYLYWGPFYEYLSPCGSKDIFKTNNSKVNLSTRSDQTDDTMSWGEVIVGNIIVLSICIAVSAVACVL